MKWVPYAPKFASHGKRIKATFPNGRLVTEKIRHIGKAGIVTTCHLYSLETGECIHVTDELTLVEIEVPDAPLPPEKKPRKPPTRIDRIEIGDQIVFRSLFGTEFLGTIIRDVPISAGWLVRLRDGSEQLVTRDQYVSRRKKPVPRLPQPNPFNGRNRKSHAA